MTFSVQTYALQTVNFLVLVVLLRRFLYKPVLRMIDARQERLARERQEVGDALAAVEDERRKLEAARAEITRERADALRAATTEAATLLRDRTQRAEAEALSLLDGARKKIAAERDAALASTREAVLDLAVGMARRLLAEVPADTLHDAWLERAERQLLGMDRVELRRMVQGESGGAAAARVVTASAVSEQEQAKWRARLARHLGEQTEVGFEVAAELVGGVDVHFPNAVLRGSWSRALESMRKEIARDERVA